MQVGQSAAQSSRLAEFGGRGMSFNICRGTLGSLAMFTAIRNASSRVSVNSRRPSALFREGVRIGPAQSSYRGREQAFNGSRIPGGLTRRSKTALRNKMFADIAPGLRWSLLSA